MPGFDMSDYVPVNERVAAFLEKHADGSLQSEIVELTSDRVTVKAYAYRSPDDARPGIGHSSLEIPGKTTFTRGSEIENAETSAWGRAIAALGFEVKRGLASAEEVRNKQPERGERPTGGVSRSTATTPAPAQYRRAELAALMKEHRLNLDGVEVIADRLGITERPMSDESMDRLIEAIEQPSSGVPDASAVDEAQPDSPPGPAAPTLDDVLAVSGGELIPPKPGTPEYKALPNGTERANAKAYWEREAVKA